MTTQKEGKIHKKKHSILLGMDYETVNEKTNLEFWNVNVQYREYDKSRMSEYLPSSI